MKSGEGGGIGRIRQIRQIGRMGRMGDKGEGATETISALGLKYVSAPYSGRLNLRVGGKKVAAPGGVRLRV